jgi:hypothetical protein
VAMKKANGVTTMNGAASAWNNKNNTNVSKRGNDDDQGRQDENRATTKLSWNPIFETTQFPTRTRPTEEEGTSKPATALYVAGFHPLSYLFTVVRGNLQDDCDEDGKPLIPTAIPGVLNRKLCREFHAKITKLNREIDDIQKRIDGMHDTVNTLNKERCSSDSDKSGNFGNEIYLLVRNVGMWMRRMETKAQLIERIEWSIYILEALQEIDESCNATMFWLYASWRKIQHKIGPGGTNEDWDNDLGKNGPKYDKYKSDAPEIIRLFSDYEAAYRRNIEISKLIKDDLIRSGSDEKLTRFLDDNYTHCKGCRGLFCRRYDDLFGTRIRCPSKIKARENLIMRGTTGEEDGSNLIECFFCTDCFDIFNPSIIKKMKRDKELKIEKDLEDLIQEHEQEQENVKTTAGNSNGSSTKSNKKRKKKKRKKSKKNNVGGLSPTGKNGAHHKHSGSSSSLATFSTAEKANEMMSVEGQHSDAEQEEYDNIGITLSASYESQNSVDDLDEKENNDINDTKLYTNGANSKNEIGIDGDSSMNDVWVDFLLKTGSIIELNAFMDKTIGTEKD